MVGYSWAELQNDQIVGFGEIWGLFQKVHCWSMGGAVTTTVLFDLRAPETSISQTLALSR